ncbi:MAG: type VI secretion protein IcmF/TssM N-terminal domain-containing protein [Planctomycetota bacterium]
MTPPSQPPLPPPPEPTRVSGGFGLFQVVAILAVGIAITLVLVTAGLFYWFTRDWIVPAIVLGGLILVGLTILLLRSIIRRQRRRKSQQMAAGLQQQATYRPNDSSAEDAAAQEACVREFNAGLEKFKNAGKSVYDLPWYLVVGEPGSGKTKAIRESEIGFPPGLQDPTQGAGGTYTMHWWFTNHAVLLDTAGRMMFGDEREGPLSQGFRQTWHRFLDELRKSRPRQPVNGLVLFIPATSLIEDDDAEIDRKAGIIQQNLDVIQKRLGARFPVFVVVSKCDKILGFSEYFDTIEDRMLAHQMFGWSNAGSLDDPFDLGEASRGLDTIYHRLVRRRSTVLAQTAKTFHDGLADVTRPLDRVDALYGLPSELHQRNQRLLRYLERILVSDAWSQPLFLRGIYFTTALRENDALDETLSRILNVPAERLVRPGKVVERSYFIGDLFVDKVFREKGLIAGGAKKVRDIRRGNRLAIVGTSLLMLGLIGVLFWSGVSRLDEAVLDKSTFWRNIRAVTDDPQRPIEIIRSGRYAPGDGLVALHEQAPGELDSTITAPGLFKLTAWVRGDQLSNAQEAAKSQRSVYRRFFRQSVATPLMERFNGYLTLRLPELDQSLDGNANAALVEAILQWARFDAATHSQGDPEIDLVTLSLEPFLAHLAEGDLSADVAVYDEALRAAHGLDRPIAAEQRDAVRRTLFGEADDSGLLDETLVLRAARYIAQTSPQPTALPTIGVGDFPARQERLVAAAEAFEEALARRPKTEAEYADLRKTLSTRFDELASARNAYLASRDASFDAFASFPGDTDNERLASVYQAALAEIRGPLEPFIALPPAPPVAGTLRRELETVLADRIATVEAWHEGQLATLASLQGGAMSDAEWAERLAEAERLSRTLQPMAVLRRSAEERLASDGTLSALIVPDDATQGRLAEVDFAARRHALLASAVGMFPATEADVTRRVRDRSTRSRFDERLPFVPRNSAIIDRDYEPGGFARLLEDLAVLTEAIATDDGTIAPDVLPPRVLLLDGLDTRRRAGISTYAASFAAHWDQRKDSELQVSPSPQSWSEDRRAIATWDQFLRPVAELAAVYGEVEQASARARDLLDLPQTEAESSISEWRAQLESLQTPLEKGNWPAVDRWQLLSDVASEAAEDIGPDGPAAMSNAYLVLGETQGVAETYRREVTRRLLLSLASAVRPGAAAGLERELDMIERFVAFPLRPLADAQDRIMTRDDMDRLSGLPEFKSVQAFNDAVDRVARRIEAAYDANEDRPDRESASRAFRRLFLSEAEDTGELADAMAWFRGPEEPTVSVRVPSRDVQERLGDARASVAWREAVFNGEATSFREIDTGFWLTQDLVVRESTLTLGVHDRRGTVVIEPLGKTWNAIELVDRYYVGAGEGDGAVLLELPFVYEERDGGDDVRPLLVGLVFDPPLPASVIDRAEQARDDR